MNQQLGILSDYQSISRSPLNESVSKMLYSFPKERRFNQNKKRLSKCKQYSSINEQYYDLPGTRTQRSTSMGYGNKLIFGGSKEKQNQPSPSNYKIRGQFETHQGFSFGLGREKMFISMFSKQTNPGPGSYKNNQSSLSKVAFSLRQRTPLAKVDLFPGPGTYDSKMNTSSQFRKPLVTFLNQRSQRSSVHQSLQLAQFPGPGSYKLQQSMSPNSRYVLSTNQSNGQRFFPTAKREPMGITNVKFVNIYNLFQKEQPGPGYYQLPSEFGYYGSPKTRRRIKTML